MSDIVDRLRTHANAPALLGDDGLEVSYTELADRVEAMAERLGPGGRLVVIEAENEVEPLVLYLASLRSRNPVMLTPPDREDLRASILARYRPDWVQRKTPDGWRLDRVGDSTAARDADAREFASDPLHPDLAVLLSTSGSTGTPKFVRLSHRNIDANARSIIEYLGIDETDRAATTLPFHYSYGFSVVNSHLLAGASLVLTKSSVIEERFWQSCEEHGVTSFAGVPYTFELLDRVGFEDRPTGTLRTLTQAGGRLPREQVLRYEAMGRRAGWQLVVMYGQTEASPRMAYVPPDRLGENPDSIGIAIPGGEFRLLGDAGNEIESADTPGELVYRGPNVMMGYAEGRADLSRGPELEELRTGDLAERDENGLYRIVGRTSRFIKVFGLRLNLDDIERKLATDGLRAIATGQDESLVIATLDRGEEDRIRDAVAAWCKLPPAVVTVLAFDDYPLLPSGKIDYAALQARAGVAIASGAGRASDAPREIRTIIREGTNAREVSDTSTFVNLGGDSLSYIKVSLELEALLGYVPPRWETMSIAELEGLERRRGVWHQIETSILLRAIAIVVIVCNHFGLFEMPFFDRVGFEYPRGSAIVLLVIAGFNFARFQWPRAAERGAGPILVSLGRVALPTVLFLLAIELVSGKFHWATILMVSNFIGPNVNFGIEPWFIYVLLQILLILAIPFAIPAFRARARSTPYAVAVSLLALTTFTSLAGPAVWDTEHLYTRVPHMLFYAFMLGACIAWGQRPWQKVFHSAVLFAFLALVMSHFTWWVLVGGLILIWTQHVWLVWPINRVAGSLGAASLFIYLAHNNFQQYTHRLLGTESFVIDLAAGLIGGIVLWAVWERGMGIAEVMIRRLRSSAS